MLELSRCTLISSKSFLAPMRFGVFAICKKDGCKGTDKEFIDGIC